MSGPRAIVASSLSSVLLLGAIVAILYLAPGGATVRNAFFDPHSMWQALVGDPGKGLSSVGKGLLTNAWMFVVAEALVLSWVKQ